MIVTQILWSLLFTGWCIIGPPMVLDAARSFYGFICSLLTKTEVIKKNLKITVLAIVCFVIVFCATGFSTCGNFICS